MRIPSLADFLGMECGEVLGTALFATYLMELIQEWATGEGPTEGQLPKASGRAFAEWLNNGWNDWTEEGETTVKDVLEGAVSDWCGGRSF